MNIIIRKRKLKQKPISKSIFAPYYVPDRDTLPSESGFPSKPEVFANGQEPGETRLLFSVMTLLKKRDSKVSMGLSRD